MVSEKRGSHIVLTCTGGRPGAFALCRNYMAHQTTKPDAWVIVDDCDPRTAILGEWFRTEIIRPESMWKQGGPNTVASNFVAGLEFIRDEFKDAEIISVMEDDDWYHPHYLEISSQRLRGAHEAKGTLVIGENNTVFFHVGSRIFRRNWHPGTSSLCSMSFHAGIIDNVLDILIGYKLHDVDRKLFSSVRPEKYELFDSDYVVGIKGIPGFRDHAGIGSKMAFGKGEPDPDMRLLRNLIGDDVRLYERFYMPLPLEVAERPKVAKKPRAKRAPTRARVLPPRRPTKAELDSLSPTERRALARKTRTGE